MTHFVGILNKQRDGALPDAASQAEIKSRVLKGLSRVGHGAPSVAERGRLWAGVLGGAPEACTSFLPHPDGIGLVAGDPLLLEDPAALAAGSPVVQADSAAAVLDALRAGRLVALCAVQGMFAAASWQPETGTLCLATDKLANRPLYYKDEADRFVFATSLRLLRLACGEAEQVDERGFAELLYFGQPLGPRTVFAGIQVLRPGEWLRLAPGSPPQRQFYFDFGQQAPMEVGRDEALQRLHQAFSRAVRRRLSPGPQEAFLSGGMDSRAVVAELVDQGQDLSTFCAAYPGSIDDVVARQVSHAFGSRHHTWHRSPADRIKVALDPFAIYARDHFPASTGRPAGKVRPLWSGDGGSVMLGHVYMNAERVRLAGGKPSAELMRRLFPALQAQPTRQISAPRLRQLSELALEGVLEEFNSYASVAPDRRLFQFYARNDQARHLYHHFEAMDLSRVDLLTPFFDAEFVALVYALPIAWFLDHRLYNDWITGFRCPAGDIYWQPYRGHLPCPHPNPSAASDQWDQAWYAGPEVRRAYQQLATDLLGRQAPLAEPFLRRGVLHLCKWANRLGAARYNYEVAYARNLIDALEPAA